MDSKSNIDSPQTPFLMPIWLPVNSSDDALRERDAEMVGAFRATDLHRLHEFAHVQPSASPHSRRICRAISPYHGQRPYEAALAWSLDDCEETIYGIDKVLTWTVDGKQIEGGPGQALCIPRGAIHRFKKRKPGCEDTLRDHASRDIVCSISASLLT
jgi:hypothetical protein